MPTPKMSRYFLLLYAKSKVMTSAAVPQKRKIKLFLSHMDSIRNGCARFTQDELIQKQRHVDFRHSDAK
eukprot:5296934-Pleurochrysis_carterae.AAC.1